jgi:hypothetical protein
MTDSLAIVLGAGASKDCVAEGGITEFESNWRPPLTAELFAPRPSFNEILRKYPKVSAVSENIRVRLRNSENLEDILKDLISVGSPQVKKQVWEVTFYLQELLWTVSEKFVMSGGTKYDTLVQRLLSSEFGQILFFTLNYDLFLDRALSTFDDVFFGSIDSYFPADKRWSLIKPHGSVNWGRQLLNGRSDTQNPDLVLGQMDGEPDLASDIEVMKVGLSQLQVNQRNPEGKMFFPAMALPARGDKDFVCPTQHVEKAEQFFAQCKTFLFIGFSGLDPHVLALFAKVPSVE